MYNKAKGYEDAGRYVMAFSLSGVYDNICTIKQKVMKTRVAM